MRFRVWAPLAETVSVRILSEPDSTRESHWTGANRGYFEGVAKDVRVRGPLFLCPERAIERPDPASRFQPEGVHGPSADSRSCRFPWHDDGWKGIALRDFIIYELHVGTFTKKGTFEAVVDHLDLSDGPRNNRRRAHARLPVSGKQKLGI